MQAPKPPVGASVEGVLRKTMPRDADAVLSLDVAVTSFSTGSVEKTELLASVQATDLLYLIEDAGGARGLAFLDAPLVSGIIEVQVAGAVSPQAPAERVPTRTDGIVVGEVVDKWLTTAEGEIGEAGLSAAWPLTGFERDHGNISRREADLLLEPGEFRRIEIAISLEGGARNGRICLAVPLSVASTGEGAATLAARLRGHLPDCQVDLRAVLARMPREVAWVRGLAPDQVLPLPEGCLQQVRLESLEGRAVGDAKLGQLGGKRAVRLSDASQSASAAALLPQPTPSELAGASDAAEAPMPELPDLPGDPLVSDDLPSKDALPELPDLPDLPDPSALPDLPDLPEMPDLPPLP